MQSVLRQQYTSDPEDEPVEDEPQAFSPTVSPMSREPNPGACARLSFGLDAEDESQASPSWCATHPTWFAAEAEPQAIPTSPMGKQASPSSRATNPLWLAAEDESQVADRSAFRPVDWFSTAANPFSKLWRDLTDQAREEVQASSNGRSLPLSLSRGVSLRSIASDRSMMTMKNTSSNLTLSLEFEDEPHVCAVHSAIRKVSFGDNLPFEPPSTAPSSHSSPRPESSFTPVVIKEPSGGAASTPPSTPMLGSRISAASSVGNPRKVSFLETEPEPRCAAIPSFSPFHSSKDSQKDVAPATGSVMVRRGSRRGLGLRRRKILRTVSLIEPVERILAAPPPSAGFGSTVVSLLKNMLGGFFMELGDAVKFTSFVPCFIAFLLASAIASCTMVVVAVLCHRHRATSYRDLWTKVVGPRSAPLVDACICLNSVFSCVSVCIFIGNSLTQGLQDMWGDALGHTLLNRVVVAVVGFFPLALLRDLHSLRHSSAIGVVCSTIVVCFIVWQVSYHREQRIPGRTCGNLHINSDGCTSAEVFWQHLFMPPSPHLVSSFNMFAGMLMAHYNVPKFYAEYQQQDPIRFARAIFFATFLCFGLGYSLSMASVLRFGTNMPDGNVIRHFNDQFPGKAVPVMSHGERLVTLFTLCLLSLNVMASFPLSFLPLRVSMLHFYGTSIEVVSPTLYVWMTFGLLAVCVFLGAIAPTSTLVLKFQCAICGIPIAYVFPAVLLWKDRRGPRSNQIVCGVLVVLVGGTFLSIYTFADAVESLLRAFQ